MDPQDVIVVIAYQDESVAHVAQERLRDLSVEELVDFQTAAFLTKDQDGAVHVDRPRAHGSRWHIFGGKGAAIVADEIVNSSAQALAPGQAALCVLVHDVEPEKVVPELSKYGGTIIRTSLPPEREQLFKEAMAEHLTSEQIAAKLQEQSST